MATKRATILLLCLVSVLVGASVLRPPIARADTNCTAHCYGVVVWPGSMQGVRTSLTPTPFTCAACVASDGFVLNSVWLTDIAAAHWVEVGVTLGDLGPFLVTSESYYWADQRPGQQYAEHSLGTIPSGDMGQLTTLIISASGPNTYSVTLVSPHVATTVFSTGNSMVPFQIQLGAEIYLAHTSGVSMGLAQFAYTQWDGNGFWHYQAPDGISHVQAPLQAGWYLGLRPSTTGWGGDWFTACCS